MVPALILISLLVFGLIVITPGDPAVTFAGANPSPEHIQEVRELLGLDQPLWRQYASWLGGVLSFDLGTSFSSSQTVSGAIESRIPITLSLTALTLVFAIVGGGAAGLIAGIRPGGIADRLATFGASLGVSIPHFWLGLVLIILFALSNRWLPAGGYVRFTDAPWEWLRHMILPSMALGAAAAAEIARQTRASIVGVLQQDYVRTARAKGLPPYKVIGKHALKNAAIPVVTVIGLQASRLVGGTVVIEQAFALPGIGQLAYRSVILRDFPMVQGVVLAAAVMVLLINLFVDLSYSYFNPKVRQ